MRVPELPKLTKDHLVMLTVSTIVVVVSIAYLILIGIPMTQARNEYNRGYRLYENGRLEQSQEALEHSLEIWYSDEAEELLKTVSDQLGEYSSTRQSRRMDHEERFRVPWDEHL